MIRKFFKIDASMEELSSVMWAFETWPEWVPDVRKMDVIKKDAENALIDMTIASITTINTRLSVNYAGADTIEFKQVKGWFKKFSGQWRMLRSPQGVGTTLTATVDMQVGLLLPTKLCLSEMSEFFDGFAHGLENRIKLTVPKSAKATQDVTRQKVDRKILQVFQQRKGLEIWFLGKRYELKEVR